MGAAAQALLKGGNEGSIELGLLGPLEARREGVLVSLGPAKQRALLAILLLRPNEVVARDKLIDQLWGDARPKTAEHALEVYVSKLRRLLGKEVLGTRAGGYVLTVQADSIDSVRFERLVERGRLQLTTDVAAAAETLRAALALWRGPALIDVAYEQFAQAEIARLDELRVAALEDRIDADLRLGRHAELVPEVEAALRDNPLRERLWAQLMLACYRSGRQADALDAYSAARDTLLDELGLEPSVQLRELQAAILRQDPALEVEPSELRGRRHLPTPATPFLGRREQVAIVLSYFLKERARLVTLTGPGGSGKTRLALRAAHELAAHYDDGVYFADLSAVTDPALVGEAIAAALEAPDATPLENYLAARRLLLVLDNFEQIDAAAPAVGELLSGARHLSVLVTSRSPLRVYGEYVLAVPPLAREDAAELFITRATAAGRPLEPSPEIDDICAWVDRLPLAIELVAARAREHSPGRTLELLPPRLELAARGPRDTPARQQTLRATIDWSYALLDDAQRTLLARLAVFAGAFTPEAARTICDAELPDLASLVMASLLGESDTTDDEPRLVLLQTIREFALERLDELHETASLRRRHARFYLELAEQAAPELEGAAERWFERLEAEHDNLRAALDWAAEYGTADEDLRIVVALRRFWLVRGHVREAQRRLEASLRRSCDQPARLRAIAAGAAGTFALNRDDWEGAKAWTEHSLELFRSLDDDAGISNSFNRLGDIAKAENRLDAAADHYATALEVARRTDDRHPLGAVLTNAGAFALQRSDLDEADVLTQEALTVWGELGHTEGIAIATYNLGVTAIERGALADALPYLEQGFDLARRLGFTSQLALTLAACATVAARNSAPERAATMTAAADQLLGAVDARLTLLQRRWRDEAIAASEAGLTQAQLAGAREAGRAMSIDEAVEYGLDTVRAAARR